MDVFDLYAKISLDSKNYETGLSKASDKFKSFKSGLSTALANIAKITTAAVTSGATAVGAIVKSATSEYAEYEQLVGGVETMFKDSADKVKNYASTAFSSVQMSSNQYMQTVTSFSASLIQSLGGDTDKAADKANKALVDMADNANKMGTNMESIQNAYQGFSKGNWMMLDNLKLGYGGTAKEMKRLLDDAAKVDSQFKKTAKYTMDEKGHLEVGFATVVDAIHIVQEQMGITGTSAEEASTTIQGSMSSVKAAWQDTLTAMGSGKDLDKKLDNLKKSVSKFGDNIKPTLKTSLKGAVSVVTELAPDVAKELPELVVELAPDLLKCGADIVSNLAGAILDEIPKLKLGEHAKELGTKLNEMIDKVDADASGKEFADVINEVIDAAFNLVETFDVTDSATKLTDWFNSAVDNIDWAKLGNTVGDSWKGVWDFIRTSISEINWENVGEKLSEFINGINWSGILNSMFGTIGEIIKNTPSFIRGVVRKMDFENASALFATLFAPKMASKLLKTIKEDVKVGDKLTKVGNKLGEKVGGGADGEKIGSNLGTKIANGLSTAKSLVSSAIVGWQIGTLIYNAVKPTIDDFIDELVNGADRAANAEKKTEEGYKKTTKSIMNNLKKAGLGSLYTEKNVREYLKKGEKGATVSDSDPIKKALNAIEYANRYGGTASQYIFDEDLYNKAKAGKLPYKRWDTLPENPSKELHVERGSSGFDPKHYQAKTGQASKLEVTYEPPPIDIYIDPKKLVGGTQNAYSNASSQEYNFAARGLAT